MPWFLALAAVGGVVGFAVSENNRKRRARTRRRAREEELLAPFREAMHPAATLLGVRVPRLVLLHPHDNAAAWPDRIGISRAWLDDTMARFCNDACCQWSVLVGVAAHELAHYTLRHPGNYEVDEAASRTNELAADFVAGWVLRRLDLDPRHFGLVLRELAKTCGTHPAWPSRLAALRRGYGHGHAALPETLRRHAMWLANEAAVCRTLDGWLIEL